MADVTIQLLKNGPLLVTGVIELKDAQGNSIQTKDKTIALCRCGGSSKKPFCDGAHVKANFQG
ncbi:MAG: CDGSH iron-sulfur domain-containing protein [Candidatus Omnitrophica bacterium]|nr:CDGSH iron-sulfur domain-containing protein [Candidatus Omnitrophota bacterium]